MEMVITFNETVTSKFIYSGSEICRVESGKQNREEEFLGQWELHCGKNQEYGPGGG
jgi:hypothetical protein